MFLEPLRPLTKRQKALLVGVFLCIIMFGLWVELRGAYLQRPMTDLQVYLRAAYAVRTGGDIYEITDDNDWHYVYPPFFAILLTPLADPPKGIDRTGYLPFGFSVGFWYIFTMALALWGIHILAKAIEEQSPLPIKENISSTSTVYKYHQMWWAIRLIPFLILSVPIGRSQMRGQVGLIIAFLICLMSASILKQKRFQAGIWLSMATAIKVIPAFLFLLPLWRRDWKMLFGGLIGLLISLLILPMITMGIENTINSYKSFFHEVLLAGAKGETNSTRGDELTCITCTDSNSPMTVIHNIINPDRLNRPKKASAYVREAHWLIAILLTFITLYVSKCSGDKWYASRANQDIYEVLFLGLLLLLMCIISPVFHPHYISMVIPLIMAILWVLWQRYGYRQEPLGYKIIFWFLIVSHIITSIGGVFWFTRDFGLVLLSSLLLWIGGIILLKGKHETERTV